MNCALDESLSQMPTILRLFCFSIVLASAALAATKTLTVSGGNQIKVEYDGKMPRTVESRGIRTDMTGFLLEANKLVPALGFACDGPPKSSPCEWRR